MAADPATAKNSNVNINLPPNRSVSMPIGNRATEPSRTGTAIRSAVSWAERLNCDRKVGAKALISPHAPKQTANEMVPQRRLCTALDGLVIRHRSLRLQMSLE